MARGAPSSRADLGLDRASRARARRVLRRHEATWHDGDENLVRGWLDRWEGPGEDTRTRARRIVEAADALAAMGARRETLWFFAWELESLLPSVVAAEGAAD